MRRDVGANPHWTTTEPSEMRGPFLLDRTIDQLHCRTRATFHAKEGLGHFHLTASVMEYIFDYIFDGSGEG